MVTKGGNIKDREKILILKYLLDSKKIKKSDFAKCIGVSPSYISQVLNDKYNKVIKDDLYDKGMDCILKEYRHKGKEDWYVFINCLFLTALYKFKEFTCISKKEKRGIGEVLITDLLCKYLPEFWNKVNENNRGIFENITIDDFYYKGSVGMGRKADVLWSGAIYKPISGTSSTIGLYPMFIIPNGDFREFYISIMVGINSFSNRVEILKDKVEKIRFYLEEKRLDYSAKGFTTDKMELGKSNSLMTEAYQNGSIYNRKIELIVSESMTFSEELETALLDSLLIFDQMLLHLLESDLISKIVKEQNTTQLEDEDLMRENENIYSLIKQKKELETQIQVMMKTKIGVLAEKYVFQLEKERIVRELGKELSKKVQLSQGCFYDIKSFDIDKDGRIVEKYILVKSMDKDGKNKSIISENMLRNINDICNEKNCTFSILYVNSYDITKIGEVIEIKGLDEINKGVMQAECLLDY